jgi:hypothetical protein
MREKTTERRRKDEFVVLQKTSPPVHFKGDEPDQEALVCPTGCSSRALLLWRQTTRRTHDRFCSGTEEGEVRAFPLGRVRWKEETFVFCVQRLSRTSADLFLPCVERACS